MFQLENQEQLKNCTYTRSYRKETLDWQTIYSFTKKLNKFKKTHCKQWKPQTDTWKTHQQLLDFKNKPNKWAEGKLTIITSHKMHLHSLIVSLHIIFSRLHLARGNKWHMKWQDHKKFFFTHLHKTNMDSVKLDLFCSPFTASSKEFDLKLC